MTRRRIFISSVQKELAEEREALRDYIDADPLGIRGGFVTAVWRKWATVGKNVGDLSGKMSGTTEQRIVQRMRENPEITIPLAQTLRKVERTIERKIATLREQAIIARVGPAHGGHWEILE